MDKSVKSDPFWSKGLRFECQGSAKCCLSRGGYGYVYLTLSDRKRFARYFKMSTQSFTKKYCEKTDGYFHFKEVAKGCRFLDENRCSVYEARPTQCRTWPFWPENMNARAWNRDVAKFCPGAGKGKLHSAKEIEKILKMEKSV